MIEHTPGPWWATDHGIRDRGGYIAHTTPVQRYAGQDERYAHEVARREADKRLIAAAPELLAALRPFADVDLRTQGVHHLFAEHVLRARAAISSAEKARKCGLAEDPSESGPGGFFQSREALDMGK